VDWNSDGLPDIVSGERHGYFNVFIRQDTVLTGFRHYRILDSTEMDVGMSSEPAVVDWNGDGHKDLLLSEEAGTIRVYTNLTSDTWPMFQDFTLLEAAGQPINLFRVSPYIFDLDMDSTQDLVCGLESGHVLFFDNAGTNARPQLAAPETVRTVAGKPVEPSPPAQGAARCGLGDWNCDGVPDFLIGCGAGTVEVFTGVLPIGIDVASLAAPGRFQVRPSLGRPPFFVEAPRQCRVVVSDALGRVVRTLSVSPCSSAFWDGFGDDGRRSRPGVYFCRVVPAYGTTPVRIAVIP